jgi:hypothetical protein
MIKDWLTLLNYFAVGVIALLLIATCYLWWAQRSLPAHSFALRKPATPKSVFARTQEDYNAIGPPAFQLNFAPLNAQLPDLRRVLSYYGRNSRPDAQSETPSLFFGFTGNKAPTAVAPGQRLYILYDRSQNPAQYVFSPHNTKAPLWMEAHAHGNAAYVNVWMQTEEGLVIREPASYADFTLTEKEYPRTGGGGTWELGKIRVDGTLLARQKARWYGVDKFLEKHGGKEFEAYQNKQRIDFGENESLYSVYVGMGDCLIWNEQRNRWEPIRPGVASIHHNLMCVKKIDERVMSFELWDADGKGKIALNLIKINEAWNPQVYQQQFKFIGARTRSQFMFEVNHVRMLLKPHDWLLLVDGSWKKLITPDEIDAYVERRTIGPLFVFDKVERKEERQVIVGTLFNAARTEASAFELPLQQTSAKKGLEEKMKKGQETNISPMIKREDKQIRPKQEEAVPYGEE